MPREKKKISRFPDPRLFGDIVAVGGTLSLDYLIDAYRHGIFPWPMGGTEKLPWFCPESRAVLFFKDLHIPRSLEKIRKKSALRFTIDQAFDQVIHLCADTPRPEQDGTWITEEVLDAYIDLHRAGHAHSVEVWEDEILVGGAYGVDAGGAFAAESMFFKKPYASKLALLHLFDHLQSRGAEWIDIQILTPHMEALGAREISRDEFLLLLSETQSSSLKLF